MPTPTTTTITASNLRRGDVIPLRGTYRTVIDIRQIGTDHKRLFFTGGASCTLRGTQTVQALRLQTVTAQVVDRP